MYPEPRNLNDLTPTLINFLAAYKAISALGIPLRLWVKIRLSDNGCWEWTGRRLNGYGHVTMGSKKEGTYGKTFAHRVFYTALVSPIPDGSHIDHLCRNRPCVNPSHLEPVTPRENALRAMDRHASKRQTHCLRGHPLSGLNLRMRNGRRVCRACHREKARARYKPRPKVKKIRMWCRHGHPYSAENRYMRRNGSTYCRICHRESARRYYEIN